MATIIREGDTGGKDAIHSKGNRRGTHSIQEKHGEKGGDDKGKRKEVLGSVVHAR